MDGIKNTNNMILFYSIELPLTTIGYLFHSNISKPFQFLDQKWGLNIYIPEKTCYALQCMFKLVANRSCN